MSSVTVRSERLKFPDELPGETRSKAEAQPTDFEAEAEVVAVVDAATFGDPANELEAFARVFKRVFADDDVVITGVATSWSGIESLRAAAPPPPPPPPPGDDDGAASLVPRATKLPLASLRRLTRDFHWRMFLERKTGFFLR